MRKYTGWGKSQAVNQEGRLVFWEIIETFDFYPFSGDIDEIIKKYQEIKDRLHAEGEYDRYQRIEIDDNGYMGRCDDENVYHVVGQRVESDQEFSQRMKEEQDKKEQEEIAEKEKQQKQELKERETLAKLKEKYKE